jgi:hypothetical protein
MEALGAAIFIVGVGGILTGIILLTIDEHKQWKAKREANKK